jgi:hypothetical protein
MIDEIKAGVNFLHYNRLALSLAYKVLFLFTSRLPFFHTDAHLIQ